MKAFVYLIIIIIIIFYNIYIEKKFKIMDKNLCYSISNICFYIFTVNGLDLLDEFSSNGDKFNDESIKTLKLLYANLTANFVVMVNI